MTVFLTEVTIISQKTKQSTRTKPKQTNQENKQNHKPKNEQTNNNKIKKKKYISRSRMGSTTQNPEFDFLGCYQ